EPFASWLLRHGQTARTISRYWATVLVSALNERLDQMDVGHARKVFLDGFLRTRDSYVMEVPTVPLGELYGTRLEGWLSEHEIEVRLKTGVRSVEVEEGSVTGLQLRDGSQVDADFVILSAPFNRVLDLLGPSAAQIPSLSQLTEFQSSPITGVHLWFDREVCPLDHAVIVDRSVQWVFNHSALQGRRDPASSGQYLQLVISAAYDLAPLTNEAILQIARDDLGAIWPESRDAQLLRWRVVTEHGATFAVRPGVEALRPSQRTSIDGLFLAGDWTHTGWPATMEGAVRSGYLAAEGVLSDLGRPEPLVRPDLPEPFLSRLLLGPTQPVRTLPRTESRAVSGAAQVPTAVSS
ncbi:MAG TPA: hydroxysqualene dehydroxylase HpnE, partial [Isosphaeraceae bacterium]|nr:hydroxysqualene dehydroxylase HpnE [Isosphaeraceae bacterium]